MNRTHPMTRLLVTVLLAAAAIAATGWSDGWVARMTHAIVDDRGMEWSVYATWYSAIWIGLATCVMGILGIGAALIWGRLLGPPNGFKLLALGPIRLGWKRVVLLILSASFPTYLGYHLREWAFGPP